MTKGVRAGWAAIGAIGLLIACGSSNSDTNNGLLPFNGDSCPPGTLPSSQPGTAASAACNQCMRNNCTSPAKCVSTDCGTFFRCRCACKQSDFTCSTGCYRSFDMTCQSCLAAVNQCESQSCSNECIGGSDAGVAPD